MMDKMVDVADTVHGTKVSVRHSCPLLPPPYQGQGGGRHDEYLFFGLVG